MDASGSVPSGSNVRQQQLVPRHITIEILGEEGISSNQPVKITSFPVNSSPLKVVDFRQITMKSDMSAGSEVRVASDNNIRSLVTPAGLAKAKTQLSKVITKDIMGVSKEKVMEDQRGGSTLKTLTPRPILPKPSQVEGGGDDGNVPVRIKQISRIGTGGISEKVNVIEVIPKTVTPSYASSYTRVNQQFSSTPSSTTASNSPAVMSTGARRGRKKHSKKIYYAYVTESESDSEMGRGSNRRRKKRKRDSDIIDEKAVITHRRSKRENLSQKLAEWGLLPHGNKGSGVQEAEDYDDEMSMPEVPQLTHHPKRRRIEEEEELEPMIPGPPPKFVTVKTASPNVPESKESIMQAHASTSMDMAEEAQLALDHLQPEQGLIPALEFNDIQDKQLQRSTVQALQMQLEEALKAEDQMIAGTGVMKAEQMEKEVKNVETLVQTPLAPPLRTPLAAPVSAASPAAAPRAAGQPGGWIKKASSMLAPPLLSTHSTTPSFLPKKKVDTMNKSLMCKPIMLTKATSTNLTRMHKQIQTDENVIEHKRTVAVPLPGPQFIPLPGFAMSMPALAPLPIPVIVPVPLPLPASRKNVGDLIEKLKELQTVANKGINPLESELLDIAEVIAETKTQDDIEMENFNATIIRGVNDQNYTYPGPILPSAPGKLNGGAGGEDVLEMAMRMAADMPEDPNNLTGAGNRAHVPGSMESSRSELAMLGAQAGRMSGKAPLPVNDSNLSLKYSYALRAWKQWSEKKNEELLKIPSIARSKARFLFQTDPLMCDSNALNAGLSLFVKELTKPDGEPYSPDTILHLCLGIQFYLKENGHPDNIFFEFPYQGFTDSLNDILAPFELRLNSQHMVICRITEEHLWESTQLGCYSPQTLLNTLVYFNTKYFLLDTVQAHLNLTFSAIERSKDNQTRKLSLKRAILGRELTLSTEEHLKQVENLEDSLRDPVKIFEFYLSKCPESVRNSNKVFYLFPEKNVKPDSSYWFSDKSVTEGVIKKMLNRAKVVREVQITKLEHMQI